MPSMHLNSGQRCISQTRIKEKKVQQKQGCHILMSRNMNQEILNGLVNETFRKHVS